MTTFVIVGGGLAGAKAAETLRAEGYDGEIALFGDETERPYERPALAKGYLLGKDERDSVFVHAAAQVSGPLAVRSTSGALLTQRSWS